METDLQNHLDYVLSSAELQTAPSQEYDDLGLLKKNKLISPSFSVALKDDVPGQTSWGEEHLT